MHSRDASKLNTDVEVGNYSTGWCNLANVAFQAGKKYAPPAAAELAKELPLWGSLHEEMKGHLAAHDVPMSELSLSPILEFDVGDGKFTGESAPEPGQRLPQTPISATPIVVPEIS